VEAIAACQALEFARPLETSPPLLAVVTRVRADVPAYEQDRSLAGDIGRVAEALRSGALLEAAEAVCGRLD
jgi:histidine ammonia-lyase